MTLDFTPLGRAILTLKEALDEYQRTPNPFVRDACIQRFEYTYALAHKMLRRYLRNVSANPSEIDQMSFQDLIRTGAKQGLLANSWDRWKLYRDARNLTSHGYNENMAKEVFSHIPKFYAEVGYLHQQLTKRNVGT